LKAPARLVGPKRGRHFRVVFFVVDPFKIRREILAPITEQGHVRAVDHHDVCSVTDKHFNLLI
jgi:hypothetical protein